MHFEIKPYSEREAWLIVSDEQIMYVNNENYMDAYGEANKSVVIVKYRDGEHVSICINEHEISIPIEVLKKAVEFVSTDNWKEIKQEVNN